MSDVSSSIARLLRSPGRPRAGQAKTLAAALGQRVEAVVYPASLVAADGMLFAVARARADGGKQLLVLSEKARKELAGEWAPATLGDGKFHLGRCPMSPANAGALRDRLGCLRPGVVGKVTSAGLGDRLGLATPAHLAAVAGSGVVPVVAQQSIREMARTGRSPRQVIDDATWGVLQAGWADGWGADADHLKTTDDIDATVAAGFRMFTIDPGDHVDNEADSDDGQTCRAKYDRLPWDELEISPAECREAYYRTHVKLPGLPRGLSLELGEVEARRAAVKYGRAIAHTVGMCRHLVGAMGETAFDLEMSVDETQMPTSPAEHYFIANELKRLGVAVASLAPRFVGRFEKGVDYLGDLEVFRREFALHAAVARALGGHKLSLHSGSDKFSIYPIAADLTGGRVHLKTAGTSYLEALRAVARVQPALFREIFAFAIERYEQDKKSYHVSARLERIARPADLSDGDLPKALDEFNARQVLHVTFGSVLTARQGDEGAQSPWRFKDRLLRTLREHEDVHYQTVSGHLARHIEPFARRKGKGSR